MWSCIVWGIGSTWSKHPANTRRWANVVLMLAQCCRQWANIKTTLAQRLMCPGHWLSIRPAYFADTRVLYSGGNWHHNRRFFYIIYYNICCQETQFTEEMLRDLPMKRSASLMDDLHVFEDLSSIESDVENQNKISTTVCKKCQKIQAKTG